MAITGGIKFFEPSQNLEADGASVVASSGLGSASYMLDKNPDTVWRSAGSLDSITETLTITFSETKTLDRILLLGHNWKQFQIKYKSGASYVAFTSVKGLAGALSGITETTFALDTSYYEFAEVSTDGIQITVDKTQVVNAEKYLAQAICTSEIGTFVGYPTIKDVTPDRNMRVKKTISGRYVIQKSDETISTSLEMKSYPSSSVYNADIDLLMSLHDREDAFLVWLCGGRHGTTYFKYTLRGFRLIDVVLMQISKALALSYTTSIYTNPVNCKIDLEESI